LLQSLLYVLLRASHFPLPLKPIPISFSLFLAQFFFPQHAQTVKTQKQTQELHQLYQNVLLPLQYEPFI
jgi:hypothetical protein